MIYYKVDLPFIVNNFFSLGIFRFIHVKLIITYVLYIQYLIKRNEWKVYILVNNGLRYHYSKLRQIHWQKNKEINTPTIATLSIEKSISKSINLAAIEKVDLLSLLICLLVQTYFIVFNTSFSVSNTKRTFRSPLSCFAISITLNY